MKVRDLFKADVTRDIAPVIYFHEQSPEKLAQEVSEYIITGGYPAGDPRHARVPNGIHEEFVKLTKAILVERNKKSCDLPNVWISGFYGSGKSSFAKLLGLALDGQKLPDGSPLADALLARDGSPRAADLRAAWQALAGHAPSLAVVFDIGGIARDGEHIHTAVVRMVQKRLGYCAGSSLVADFELKLEQDGQWDAFLQAAQTRLKRPWSELRASKLAEEHFSHVLHHLDPDRYTDPTSWIDSRAGAARAGLSVSEAVEAIEAMLSLRAPGKDLYLVVDEVSQYVHQSDDRMVKLQSFASELGARAKGRIWLLVTGQAKLEDDGTSVHKLKDRFPASLRVHLSPTNIRDVVHRRLLAKDQKKEGALREAFQRDRPDLELYAHGCRGITEEDFVETYPMLPGQIDLLLRITSQIRASSSRVQGDDYAIRGLLQLLGELFRKHGLADRELGALLTLDAIYEVQHTALDPDLQTSIARVLDHCVQQDDALAARAARAVALLQYIQETHPTTAELVASCLYEKLGQGSILQPVTEALERLRAANLIGFSAKEGYKIQSSAGQEWQRERDEIGVSADHVSEELRKQLVDLLAMPDSPRLKGRPFKYLAWFSDGHTANDKRLDANRDEGAVYVDLRLLKADERQASSWVKRSDDETLRDRLVWIAGDAHQAQNAARALGRSRKMLQRYEPRRSSLGREQQKLLLEEQARAEDLQRDLGTLVGRAFQDGSIYFRGRELKPGDLGGAFGPVLHEAATRVLPELYPNFTAMAVTDGELEQLLQKTLAGPPGKFLEGDPNSHLGLLSLDAGKYVATCAGPVPSRIAQYIEQHQGVGGNQLFAWFGRPPFGFPPDVVKACLVGLLRGRKLRVQPEGGAVVTSVNDPGARDLFMKDLALRRAELFPADEGGVKPRDQIAICKLFQERFDVEVDRDNDAIADAIFSQFGPRAERLREVERRLARLPGRLQLPPPLEKLAQALTVCCRSRQIDDSVQAVKARLPQLQEGLQLLAMYESELTDDAVRRVSEAGELAAHQLAQLQVIGLPAELQPAATAITEQLAQPRPWRDISELQAPLALVREGYASARRELLAQQARLAEEARSRVKSRAGFERLTADQSHLVLRPLQLALLDTTPEAVAPTLLELRDLPRGKLAHAEEEANELLDGELSRGDDQTVVKIPMSLRGRELKSRAELTETLEELEERLGPLLDAGKRVRIT